jgi:tetratricopeptide (TPR) repeat protein
MSAASSTHRAKTSWPAKLGLLVLAPAFLLGLAEIIARMTVTLPPATFFVEHARQDGVWVGDNPYYGYTIFHPRQARTPGQSLFPAEKPPGHLRILVLGESAAMGFPDPEFGLARTISTLLAMQFPGQSFDVINGSMTEINSHILLEIMDEAMAYQPDIVVLYAGNNEAIGPYSPVGVFGRFYPARWMTHADRWLRKNSQLVRALVAWRNQMMPIDRAEWKGLDHFAGRAIRRDDPDIMRMNQYTRANVRAIFEKAVASTIPVVAAPAVVNLNDWPPLYSFIPDAVAGEVTVLMSDARSAMAQGAWESALTTWRKVLEQAPDLADAHYGAGQCLEAMGEREEARLSYETALDCDGYRFRADGTLFRIMREEAARLSPVQVGFVDARGSFFDAPNEPPLLLEHVHLTVAGMIKLSRMLADTVASMLPPLSEAIAQEVSDEALLTRLFFMPDIDEHAWLAVAQFMEMQVFGGQHGYRERMSNIEQRRALAADQVTAIDETALQNGYRAAGGGAEPADWQVEALFGRYLIGWNLNDAAVAPLRKSTKIKPDHAGNLQLLGVAQYRVGAFGDAVATLEQAIQVNPYNPEAWNMLGLARFRLGEDAAARSSYEQALLLDSDHPGTLNNLGYLDYQQGRLDAAEKLFRRALEGKPDLIEARYHLGLALFSMKRLDEAALQLDEVVLQQPGLARAWSARGMVAMLQGKEPEAEKHFIRALKEDSGLIAAYVNLASLWIKQEQDEKAERLLANALAEQPEAADLHYLNASLLAASGRADEALPSFRRAMALAPERTDWKLHAAQVLMAQGKENEAYVEEARKLVFDVWEASGQSDPAAARLLDVMGGAVR